MRSSHFLHNTIIVSRYTKRVVHLKLAYRISIAHWKGRGSLFNPNGIGLKRCISRRHINAIFSPSSVLIRTCKSPHPASRALNTVEFQTESIYVLVYQRDLVDFFDANCVNILVIHTNSPQFIQFWNNNDLRCSRWLSAFNKASA